MSLFYVTVPTRDYEVALRQKELDFQNVTFTDNQSLASLINDEKRASTGRVTGSNSGLAWHGHSAFPDVYRAVVNGKESEIVLHDDYMEVKEVNPGQISIPSRLSASQLDNLIESRDDHIEAEIRKYFLQKHLRDTLDKYELHTSATWNVSYGGKMSQVSFTSPANYSDVIIQRMHSVGIGSKYGSTITVCSADVYYGPKKVLADAVNDPDNDPDGGEGEEKKTSGWSEFVQSIKSRLTVAQVVSQVQANAVITFDYLMLVFVAGTIACLGLLEDNSVILVASMLISPLMGPIMALTFGAMIKDSALVKVGFRSEIIGLLICLGVGFISGILIAIPHKFDGPWGWGRIKQWPTGEMKARGQWRGIIVGVLMALPSGVGVALSILAGNAGSLVGVAIAASLLPPTVNCGLFWGLSLVVWIIEGSRTKRWYQPCGEKHLNGSSLFHTENYKFMYCKNDVTEYLCLGAISFGLTMVNIIIIFCVAVLILKIKEVTPYTTRQSLRRFWQEDLAATRNYNATHDENQNIAEIIDDINNAENAEEIKQNLDQDAVIRQVNRRMGGGAGVFILNEMNNSPVLNRKQSLALKNKKSRAKTIAPTGGGGWFGWLGGSKEKTDGK